MYVVNATTTVSRTVIFGNMAYSAGGGIYHGTSVLAFTTVASNTATSRGDGIHGGGGTVRLKETIVAYDGVANCNTGLTSNGYNLDSGNTCGFSATDHIINTDPLLGPPWAWG